MSTPVNPSAMPSRTHDAQPPESVWPAGDEGAGRGHRLARPAVPREAWSIVERVERMSGTLSTRHEGRVS